MMSAMQETRSGKREGCVSKEAWHMAMAILASKRSKDPVTQVGCVIVDPKGIVVSMGYNGFPIGCSDEELPWDKHADNPLETKFPYVCHAEMNAILNTNDQDVSGCILYATLFPCNECAKMIIQAGIKEVVYLCNKSKDKPLVVASRTLFDMAGVTYRAFDMEEAGSRTIKINFRQVPPPFHRSPQQDRACKQTTDASAAKKSEREENEEEAQQRAGDHTSADTEGTTHAMKHLSLHA
ncbi:deoxycytidylate deaminase [Salpingoeca rosetta]|uniref:dCMP deaminase n=1 Tax=Salpingoeca rosetta (strain ATCC 50818 / BSB-021) TaxID=946362 RepID=F2UFL6_SALR5|nr:deoxycytidylate deaminase [Salpingoeca rosetta]EGD75584.1 deoxycytidylate deaminase [Salpingoeca rosetta]|eukprot:XP_004992041.1 deoxycytidylate deaminase [Salpingoeca rosetta]